MVSSEKQKYWSQQYKNKRRKRRAGQYRIDFLEKYPQWEKVKHQLPRRSINIIEYRHAFVKDDKIPSFQDIGNLLGISKQRANTLYREAIDKLNQLIQDQSFD